MPAWALSQAIFFFLLALPFNLINAIISVPLFYIFHPLAGFVYYGFRAIEAYEQKQPKNFYYAIFSGLLLVALNLFYMGLQYKGIENYYNRDEYLISVIFNSKAEKIFFPFFTSFMVIGTLIIFYIVVGNEIISKKFENYLLFLACFFLIPAISPTFFITGSRVANLFLIYLIVKLKDAKQMNMSFLLSIIFGLVILIIHFLFSIFELGFKDFRFTICNETLLFNLESAIEKNVSLLILDVLKRDNPCIYTLLQENIIYSESVELKSHPVKSKIAHGLLSFVLLGGHNSYNLINYINNWIDYCEILNKTNIIIFDEERFKKITIFLSYGSISKFDDFYLIKVCRNYHNNESN
jgi:hypothetical protein